MTPAPTITPLSIVTPLQTWTCVPILTASAIVTPAAMWVFSPTVQSRPMTDDPCTCTPSPTVVLPPIVTPGSMIALGWTRAPSRVGGGPPQPGPPRGGWGPRPSRWVPRDGWRNRSCAYENPAEEM